LDLSEQAQLIFIGKHSRPAEDEQKKFGLSNSSIIYWGDFRSPYQLLDTVRPDLVVFHDIEAFNQIALNIAARNRNIRTLVLQHGFRGDYEITNAVNHLTPANNIELSATSWWTFNFLIRSLRWKNVKNLLPLIKFVIARKRNELTVALYRNRFELRRADAYIEFSKANATYHRMRDGVPDDRFLLIGNPAYDDFHHRFKEASLSGNRQNYALLIDTPFCEASFVQKQRMTTEEKNDYLKRLNEYCLRKNLRFYIKLHPLTYQSTGLFQDENIEYFRDVDIVELVNGSQLAFLLHFSTLAPLVLYHKPFLFFHNKYIEDADAIQALSISTYDLLRFKPEDLAQQQPHPPLSLEVLKDYLFVPDGRSRERLQQILLSEA
jgi:hypothetical protein